MTARARRLALLAAANLIAVAGAAAVLWVWLGRTPSDGGADPALVALGHTVYAAHCASCHGAKLEGQPSWQERKPDGRLPAPPHDASGHTWHHDDEQLFAIVKHGVAAFAGPGYRSDMPAFDGVLSDEEIRAVLAFIESTWPAQIRAQRAARLGGK